MNSTQRILSCGLLSGIMNLPSDGGERTKTPDSKILCSPHNLTYSYCGTPDQEEELGVVEQVPQQEGKMGGSPA